jgi:bacterioferritin-associated ferredoxin
MEGPGQVYVCLCRGLTEHDVEVAARAGATTGPVLIATLGLDDPRCCGRCARGIDRYVALAAATVARAETAPVG